MLSKMEVMGTMGTKIQPQPLLHRPIGMEYMLAGDSELEHTSGSRIWVPEPPNCTQNPRNVKNHQSGMLSKMEVMRLRAPRYSRSPCYTAP